MEKEREREVIAAIGRERVECCDQKLDKRSMGEEIAVSYQTRSSEYLMYFFAV